MLVAEPTGAASLVVLSLHGSRSGPEEQIRLSRMAPWTDQGAVVAFPQGGRRAGPGWGWDLSGDLDFLDAAIEHLRVAFGPTSARLYLTGMSAGARMAGLLASRRPDTAVLGAVAGLRAPPAGALAHGVRVVAFHGTDDRINPYAGSGRPDGTKACPLPPPPGPTGSRPSPGANEISPSLTRISYGPDDSPVGVTLWVCAGAGHTWPGSRLPFRLRRFLGRTSFEVDATAEIWRVISAH